MTEYDYAVRLAQTLKDTHYPAGPWEPRPDLMGVLIQIDNMTSGLVRRGRQQNEIARLTGALRGMLSHSCVSDAGPDMKDASDHAAESYAIKVLNEFDAT